LLPFLLFHVLENYSIKLGTILIWDYLHFEALVNNSLNVETISVWDFILFFTYMRQISAASLNKEG
jgi:hypothetical protein